MFEDDNVFFDDNNNDMQTKGLESYQEDERLKLATQECMKTGTIFPLLKEELKFKILAKCHEEGKELTVEPEKKLPPTKKMVRFLLYANSVLRNSKFILVS